MLRPPVDIVVPFVGSESDLSALVDRLGAVDTTPADTLTVADNRATAELGREVRGRVVIAGAPGRPTSYFARNRGAEVGGNDWIVFLDADVDPQPGLLEHYFDPPPPDDCGVLIGGIHDAPPGPTAVEHHAYRRGAVAHETTVLEDGFTYAQTANVAVRRAAFAAVGGFTEEVRSGGDADLCFRIRAAGYGMEPRFTASVIHRNRTDLRSFVRQNARYGSGVAWLDRRYPGFEPRPNPLRVLASLARSAARATIALARRRPFDAKVCLLDGVQKAAYVAGRRWPNEVPER